MSGLFAIENMVPIVREFNGKKTMFLCPAVPEDGSPLLKEGLARRRVLYAEGTCPCGATMDIPSNSAIKRAKRRGEILRGTAEHEADCPAGDDILLPLAAAHERNAGLPAPWFVQMIGNSDLNAWCPHVSVPIKLLTEDAPPVHVDMGSKVATCGKCPSPRLRAGVERCCDHCGVDVKAGKALRGRAHAAQLTVSFTLCPECAVKLRE